MKLTESRIKEIIKEEMELMEMDIDPTSLMLGAGAVYALYQMFFGREPSDSEEALAAVRKRIAQMEAEAEVGMQKYRKPPAQGDYQKIKAARKLAQLRKKREM